jgi:LysM repeat protein
MKSRIISLFCIASLLLFLSSSVYGMGGTPPDEQTQETIAPTSAPAAGDKRVEEVDRARAEIKQDRAELDKTEKYAWVLDSRIIEARKAGNVQKLVDLKELEMQNLAKAKMLQDSIAKKIETYPELKVSEALEAAKDQTAGQAQTAQTQQVAPIIPIEQQTAAPAPAAAAPQAAPKPAFKQQANSTQIVYHEVEAGDTLFSISRKYFGTPSVYKIIAKENNLANPGALNKGMVLKIDLRWKNMVPPAPKPAAIPQPVLPQPVVNPPL